MITTQQKLDKNKLTVFDSLKDAVPCQSIDVVMAQNVLLIWLDNDIDTSNPDYYDMIVGLHHVVNTINIFTDVDQCLDFLTDIENENVCMIISGALCQTTVPLFYHVVQLCTIFVFCEDQTRYKQWAKNWAKITGVFTEISSVCKALKQTVQQCEQNAIPMSFLDITSDVQGEKLDQLDPTFMYTQIMKEILLTIDFEEKHIQEFINYFRDIFSDNKVLLKNIDQLGQRYNDKKPIWWYIYECFLYTMLNRALRLMDVDIIIKMGFFINGLHRHIEKLHAEEFNESHSAKTFTVYRGHGMSKIDLKQMTKSKGGLFSFNSFLSTSYDRAVSLMLTQSNLSNPDLVGILFVMIIDPSKSSTPFASINRVSHFQTEDEVLFSMNTVFRICDIKPMDDTYQRQ